MKTTFIFLLTIVWASAIKPKISTDTSDVRITYAESDNKRQYRFVSYIFMVVEKKTGLVDRTCSGSIVSKKFILSAAHCFRGLLKSVTIYIGSNRRKMGKSYKPHYIKVHEEFNEKRGINDIALAKTDCIQLTDLIEKIELPKQTWLLEDGWMKKQMHLAGWGFIDQENKIAAEILKFAVLPMETISSCLQGKCVIPFKSKTRAAGGDSGGPWFFVNNEGKYVVIGVHSHRTKSHKGNSFMIFMRTDYYYDWIDRNMNERIEPVIEI